MGLKAASLTRQATALGAPSLRNRNRERGRRAGWLTEFFFNHALASVFGGPCRVHFARRTPPMSVPENRPRIPAFFCKASFGPRLRSRSRPRRRVVAARLPKKTDVAQRDDGSRCCIAVRGAADARVCA